MRRYIIALVALLMVMGLSLWGIMATSPQAGAATTHLAKAANVYPQDEIRQGCWDPSPYTDQWTWSQANQIYNAYARDDNCYSDQGVGFTFVVGNCAAPPNQGYCSLIEVSKDIAGIWQNTGNCGGFSYSLDRIVMQGCNGATYQQWAGTGGRPDLIWNRWLEVNYPHECPIAGGYTQQVITSDGDNGAVYLSCPQGAGGESYLAKQMWYLIEPLL